MSGLSLANRSTVRLGGVVNEDGTGRTDQNKQNKQNRSKQKNCVRAGQPRAQASIAVAASTAVSATGPNSGSSASVMTAATTIAA